MRYTAQKIFVSVLAVVFFIIGLGFLVTGLETGGGELLLGFGFTIFPSVVAISTWIRITRFQTQTYAWYRENHPQHAHADGVSCKNCGSRRIQVRGLLQQTYTREHVCTQCGTRLFYSPE